MTLAGLLRQSLVIQRAVASGVNEFGEPVYTWSDLATVRGSVQPKSASEVAAVSQGGAEIVTHVIYLLPTDVTAKDRIRLVSAATGPYYQITGVRDAAGRGQHLELDAHEVS
jgi:SPP1 family predicted phage head-tail adaptor